MNSAPADALSAPDALLVRRQWYRSAHLASIGTLTPGIAHELNNPLCAVAGYSSALLARLKAGEAIEPGELTSYLQVIHDEAFRCRDIVENLHRLSQVPGDNAGGRVSPSMCFTNALAMFKNKAAKAKITIINKLEEAPPVKADAVRLEQVFVQVLRNCLDSRASGSIVTVSLLSGPLSHVIIEIRDNSPDMASEAAAGTVAGTLAGMELFLCQTIMEGMNGAIGCSSEPGRGNSVTLRIPRADDLPLENSR